ncbi:MAG: NUDIX hydrolase [Candidatus Dormibacteria bacterium]
MRAAAVLIPLFLGKGGEPRTVLVRRVPGGRHGGQLAFPGGNREPKDRDAVATALREAEEEIGLEPERVQVLAQLPELETRSTGYLITPVVGRVLRPPEGWRLQAEEIAAVVEVALPDLLLPGARQRRRLQLDGLSRALTVTAIPLGEDLLWGVSLRILDLLLPRLDELGAALGLGPSWAGGQSGPGRYR